MLQSRHLCLLSCKIALSSSDSCNFFPRSNFLYNFQNILQYLLTVNAKNFQKKLIAPFLSYSIFLRGLFFMLHPVFVLFSYMQLYIVHAYLCSIRSHCRVLGRHKKADVRTSCLQFFGIRQSLLDVLHSLGLQCYAVISVVTAPPPAA